MTIQLLVAHGHGLLREGLVALLSVQPCLRVVGQAADGHQLLGLAHKRHPDVVLLDIGLSGLSSIQVTRQLSRTALQPRVLILASEEDHSLLRGAIRAGAAGCIVEQAMASELVDAIRAVHRGDVYIHPTMAQAMVLGWAGGSARRQEGGDRLTSRERQVLRKIAQGYTNREIAEQWTISVRTVETHRANLLDKLNLRSRADLVRYAMERGLLGPAR